MKYYLTGRPVRESTGTANEQEAKRVLIPMFHLPKDGPPRNGFFEPEQYQAVKRHLPTDLQAAVAIVYTYGWRMPSEVLALARRQLDLFAGTRRLDPGMTENDEGRLVYLTPDLKAELGTHVERIRTLERRTGPIIPYLFPYLTGARRLGRRRRDFRKAWATACCRAGVPGKLRHDFRRTAVRNLVDAGAPERVAMKITGHKTRSVFDRSHVVSPADLQEAVRKLTGIVSGIGGESRLTPVP